jgi:hypothetical protein
MACLRFLLLNYPLPEENFAHGSHCPGAQFFNLCIKFTTMIRKLKSGQYRIYSRKIDPKTKRRRNLGTFDTIEAARQHEKAIQYFKQH